MAVDITKHRLVPQHSKMSEAEKEKLFSTYNISTREIPKILVTDPVLSKLTVKAGDIIKIERVSNTAGNALYYRIVVEA